MAPSGITDDLLRTAVGLRIDAGVSAAKIERLIDRFSAGHPRQSTEGGLLWLGAPGIPQDRREELLQELAGLPSEPDHSPDARRTMSANDIWPLRIAEEMKMHRTGPIEETTTDFAEAPEPAAYAEPTDAADLEWALAPVEETIQDRLDGAQRPPAPVDHFGSMPEADSKEGGTTVLDQVELTQMKQELGFRRDEILTRHAKELKEMLAGHADELKALDADHKEVETVELAIDALLRKFKPSSPDASVARLDEERALRLQGLA